jgi:hypothetical protein
VRPTWLTSYVGPLPQAPQAPPSPHHPGSNGNAIHLNGSHAHACRPLRSPNSPPANTSAGRNSRNASGQRLCTTTTSHECCSLGNEEP